MTAGRVPSPATLANGVPLVFAHRGGRAMAPENTLVAFDAGIAAGADGLEFDVHLSRDGQVVIIHDGTLERTTDGTGSVAERTAAELAGVNATRRFGIDLEHRWAGAPAGVPTLEAVLARYRDAALIIEMKGEDTRLGPAVVDTIRRAGASHRVCLGSFSSAVLDSARAAAPDIPTSAGRDESLRALQRSWFWMPPGKVPYRAFQLPEVSGRLRVVSRRFLRGAHRSGCAVQVWTVNEEADMRRLFGWGVDGIVTDRPNVGVKVRDAWVQGRRTIDD
jgi:glycerophosphoryl diester phosphodiesterase